MGFYLNRLFQNGPNTNSISLRCEGFSYNRKPTLKLLFKKGSFPSCHYVLFYLPLASSPSMEMSVPEEADGEGRAALWNASLGPKEIGQRWMLWR